MNDDINETPSSTPNFQTELAAQLAELVPEAITDGKVDVTKLQELLSSDAADPTERFGLFWPGKKRALRAAQEPTTATLKPDFENSKDWDTTKNIFIEGDNLEVLKILQKHYHAKIKMIYIDPPYNTGKDFVYPDNYKEGLETYLEWTRQVNEEGKRLSTNAETEGRYHSNWLNMMYPRLKLARNLLRDDGVIFISIDDHEQDNLKKLCDEIFGANNFINQFLWLHGKGKKDSWSRTGQQYITCYARNKKALEPWSIVNTQNYTFTNPDNDPRGPWFSGSVSFSEARSNPAHRNFMEITSPSGIVWRRQWLRSNDEMNRLLNEDKIFFGHAPKYDATPRVKIFPGDVSAQIPTNIIDEVGTTRSAQTALEDLMSGAFFDYPKPVDLIDHLIKIATDSTPDATVLDFFSGSGTTAHAVLKRNAEDGGKRQHIQVQLPEPTTEGSPARKAGYSSISEVSRERIRRAGNLYQYDRKMDLLKETSVLDAGFRAFKLVDTNFSKWSQSSDVDLNDLEQHLLDLRESSSANDATPDDLLTEILLKQGYSLTEQIDRVVVAGLEVRVVRDLDGDVGVLAHLDEHIKPTLEQLRAFADEEPARMIVLEDAFQGDDELKTNLVQLCKSKGIEVWTA